jgi:hypothetical protein
MKPMICGLDYLRGADWNLRKRTVRADIVAQKISTKQEAQDAIGALVDRFGLGLILDLLADVCDDRADNLHSNCGYGALNRMHRSLRREK